MHNEKISGEKKTGLKKVAEDTIDFMINTFRSFKKSDPRYNQLRKLLKNQGLTMKEFNKADEEVKKKYLEAQKAREQMFAGVKFFRSALKKSPSPIFKLSG